MIDSQKSFYATGRRKEAVARLWIQPGERQDRHQPA